MLSILDGGEHLCGIILNRSFYVNDNTRGLVVIAPARRAGDPGSIPGPGENFSLKLLIYDLSEGYSKAKISS